LKNEQERLPQAVEKKHSGFFEFKSNHRNAKMKRAEGSWTAPAPMSVKPRGIILMSFPSEPRLLPQPPSALLQDK
jgi:hypothetical protein